MSTEAGDESQREVWEYLIDDLRRKAAQTQDEDDSKIHNEKMAIINHLVHGYEYKFGQPYPDDLGPL